MPKHSKTFGEWLEDNQPDMRTTKPYKALKEKVARLVAKDARKDARGLRSCTFGAISRQLEPDQKQFMCSVLCDLTDDKILRWRDGIEPSRIYLEGK